MQPQPYLLTTVQDSRLQTRSQKRIAVQGIREKTHRGALSTIFAPSVKWSASAAAGEPYQAVQWIKAGKAWGGSHHSRRRPRYPILFSLPVTYWNSLWTKGPLGPSKAGQEVYNQYKSAAKIRTVMLSMFKTRGLAKKTIWRVVISFPHHQQALSSMHVCAAKGRIVPLDRYRNIGISAHIDDGKVSLALLPST